MVNTESLIYDGTIQSLIVVGLYWLRPSSSLDHKYVYIYLIPELFKSQVCNYLCLGLN